MAWLSAIFLVIGFAYLLKVFKLADKAMKTFELTKHSVSVFQDPSLSDLEKEKTMQQHTISLLKLFLSIVVGSFVALMLPTLVIYLFDLLGLVSLQETIEKTLSWQFITITTLLIAALIIYRKKHGV